MTSATIEAGLMVQADGEKWAQKRHTWHIAHQVRTYGAIVAAYIAAVLAI